MLRNKSGSVEWLEFEIFQEFPQISHAIFLRQLSVGNVGGGSEEDRFSSRTSRARIQEIMQCSSLASSYQVHGADVREVPMESDDEKCDGLFTAKEDIGLLIKHADCQAAIIYDPMENVVANVHCGWRGNVKNIYSEVVAQLKSRFGSKPENLIVGISPSLGPCCGEFINYETELPRQFWEYQVKPLYFDLWEIASKQWTDAGVLPHHIQIACMCTRCNGADFFSYRREKARCGNHATIILKKPTSYRC